MELQGVPWTQDMPMNMGVVEPTDNTEISSAEQVQGGNSPETVVPAAWGTVTLGDVPPWEENTPLDEAKVQAQSAVASVPNASALFDNAMIALGDMISQAEEAAPAVTAVYTPEVTSAPDVASAFTGIALETARVEQPTAPAKPKATKPKAAKPKQVAATAIDAEGTGLRQLGKILQGNDRNILKEAVRYFVESTGKGHDVFLSAILSMKTMGITEYMNQNNNYLAWLSAKLIDYLKAKAITLDDCICNKDLMRSATESSKSRGDGEFYTPELWCVEGRKYLQELLGDQWGKIAVWDASCYSMDTELMTKRGWVTYDELQNDDLIYSLNPETLQGEFVGFHNRFVKEVDEDLIRVYGKGIDLLVTKDHSMLVKHRTRNSVELPYVQEKAQDVYDCVTRSKFSGNCVYIPSAASLSDLDEYAEKTSEDCALWKLVGAYIGNGSLQRGENNSKAKSIRFSLQEGRKAAYIVYLAKQLGAKYALPDSTVDEPIIVEVESKQLFDMIVSNIGDDGVGQRLPISQIPPCYYVDLLDGLRNSEDSCGSVCYNTDNKELADAVEYMMSVLGYSVRTVSRECTATQYGERLDCVRYSVIGTTREKGIVANSTVGTVRLEHYCGLVWDITLNSNHFFKVRRNGKSCFSGNCGTGNLMKSAGYPKELLYLSSLMDEDIEVVSTIYEGEANCFQLDFLNGIDYDTDNTWFSDKLPPELRARLEANEPICFYMNPPYKVSKANITDVGSAMNMLDMGKCGLDLFHQFIYRVLLIKRFYNLTNVTMGLFGPITFIHSQMIKELYDELCLDFKFKSGMLFDAGDFSGTSESVGWVIGYTVWQTREAGDVEPNNVLLDTKLMDAEGKVACTGKRYIMDVHVNLHDWINPTDVERHNIFPSVTAMFGLTGKRERQAENALGSLMSSNYTIRGTRRCSVTTLPCVDGTSITPENFWRCVASFAMRRCYATKQDPFANSQYLSMPAVKSEGYTEWLMNALVLLVFDNSSYMASYRNFEALDEVITMGNKLFPIDINVCRGIIEASGDLVLLEDITKNPTNNSLIVEAFKQAKDYFFPEALELYTFGLTAILDSYQDGSRKRSNYESQTQAWDASLMQIRSVKEIWGKKDEKYLALLSNLRSRLLYGVYEFGFLMNNDGGKPPEIDYED